LAPVAIDPLEKRRGAIAAQPRPCDPPRRGTHRPGPGHCRAARRHSTPRPTRRRRQPQPARRPARLFGRRYPALVGRDQQSFPQPFAGVEAPDGELMWSKLPACYGEKLQKAGTSKLEACPTMKYRIKHTTTYHYSDAVALCHNCALLTPRAFGRQLPFQEDLWIQPEPAVLDRHLDYFGNVVHFFTIQEPHKNLSVTAHHRVQVLPALFPQPEQTPAWEDVAGHLQSTRRPEVLDAYQYTFDSPYIRRQATWLDYARPSFPRGRPLWAGVLDLMGRIH